MNDRNTDVLIVGAGPVGLTLAIELAHRGTRYRIVDRAPNASDKTKALGVMARTLELLDKAGAADDFIARGHKTHSFNLFSEGKRLTRFEFDQLVHSPYPYVLMVPQNVTECILNERLAALGGGVERQIELTGLSQKDAGVEATLRDADGREEKLNARWLVGCDGAHSTVRHLLGASFGGTTFEQSFALADVHIDWELANDEIYAFLHKGDLIAYFPMDGGKRHRVIISHRKTTERDADVTLQEVQQVIDACGPAGAVASDPTWMARFRINQRHVENYRHGHVLLAGDAAHIHSPIGAQGMNTGMQDAFNLGWKLALECAGRSPEALIDSYEAERLPVGKALVQGTERFTRVALLDRSLPVTLRDHVAPFVFSLPLARHKMADTLSELAVSYRDSPLVAEDKAGVADRLLHPGRPHAGDRAPDGPLLAEGGAPQGSTRLYELLRGGRHTLLAFAGTAPAHERRNALRAVTELIAGRYSELADVLVIAADEWTDGQPDEQPVAEESIAEGKTTVKPTVRQSGDMASAAQPSEEVASVAKPSGNVAFNAQLDGRVASDAARSDAEEAFAARSAAEAALLDRGGRLHRLYGFPQGGLALIRPDGYIAYRSQKLTTDGLADYLRRLFR